jgi:hypothetical protein
MSGQGVILQTNRSFRELVELQAKTLSLRSQYIKDRKFGEITDLKDKEKNSLGNYHGYKEMSTKSGSYPPPFR